MVQGQRAEDRNPDRHKIVDGVSGDIEGRDVVSQEVERALGQGVDEQAFLGSEEAVNGPRRRPRAVPARAAVLPRPPRGVAGDAPRPRAVRPNAGLLPGPAPEIFAILEDALAAPFTPDVVAFVRVVFSLHEPDELRGLMADAGFRRSDARGHSKTLRLPSPEEFLWQYVSSTPLATAVAVLDDPRSRRGHAGRCRLLATVHAARQVDPGARLQRPFGREVAAPVWARQRR